jgi:hypothetical protein
MACTTVTLTIQETAEALESLPSLVAGILNLIDYVVPIRQT